MGRDAQVAGPVAVNRITIGIDATCWWNNRGFGRFTRMLLSSMFADPRAVDFVLFVDRPPAPEMMRANVRIVEVQTASTVTAAAVADNSRSVSDLLAFRRVVAREKLDVMYFPAVYSWYPTGGNAPIVITFHDAIAERFPALVLPNWRGRMLWKAKIWLARRSAANITTVSAAARAEIVEHLGIAESRITVIHEAPDPIFRPILDPRAMAEARERFGLPANARTIVYVGGFAPHKNLLGLLRGLAEATANPLLDDVHLVLVGDLKGDGFHSNTAELMTLATTDLRLAGRVHFTGYVSDDALVTLYCDATVVAMPAFSEGFGLPAAEAMACGTPVIAARASAVEEVVGTAGLFFDPTDVGEIAAVITQVFASEEALARLREMCLPRAGRLSWPKAAAATLDLLQATAKAR